MAGQAEAAAARLRLAQSPHRGPGTMSRAASANAGGGTAARAMTGAVETAVSKLTAGSGTPVR